MLFASRSLLLAVITLLVSPALRGDAVPSPTGQTAPCGRDTVPPHVMSLTLSERSVDVTAKSAPVVVEARVIDLAGTGVAAAGVRSVKVSVEHRLRGGSATQFLRLRPSADPVRWRATLTVPRGALPGPWRVTDVSVRDWASNWRSFREQSPWASSQVGPVWQETVDVTDTAPDLRPPTIRRITMDTSPVDTRRHSVERRVSMRVTDDVAVQGASLIFWHHYGSDVERPFAARWTSRRGGQFTGRVVVPRWLGDGVLTVSASATDANNSTGLFGDRLAARAGASEIALTSLEPPRPVLDKVVVGTPSPRPDGGVRVPVRATVDGAGADVRGVQPQLWRRGASRGYSSALVLAAGTRAHGTWRGAVIVSRCAAAGSYQLTVALRGQGRAWRDVRGSSLRAAGGPASIALQGLSGDDTNPRAVTADAPANSLAVKFSEGVRDVLPALTPVDVSTGDPLAATATCTTVTGATVPCETDEAVVRRVVFTLAAPLDATQGWPAMALNLVTPLPQVTDAGGNPVEGVD